MTGLPANKLRVPELDDPADWTTRIGYYCPITGMPENELLRKVMSFGLTTKDIVELEYLANKDVLSRMDMPIVGRLWWKHPEEVVYTNRLHVAKYMRTWADMLTEEGKLDMPESEPQPQHETTLT